MVIPHVHVPYTYFKNFHRWKCLEDNSLDNSLSLNILRNMQQINAVEQAGSIPEQVKADLSLSSVFWNYLWNKILFGVQLLIVFGATAGAP